MAVWVVVEGEPRIEAGGEKAQLVEAGRQELVVECCPVALRWWAAQLAVRRCLKRRDPLGGFPLWPTSSTRTSNG